MPAAQRGDIGTHALQSKRLAGSVRHQPGRVGHILEIFRVDCGRHPGAEGRLCRHRALQNRVKRLRRERGRRVAYQGLVKQSVDGPSRVAERHALQGVQPPQVTDCPDDALPARPEEEVRQVTVKDLIGGAAACPSLLGAIEVPVPGLTDWLVVTVVAPVGVEKPLTPVLGRQPRQRTDVRVRVFDAWPQGVPC